ncbi:SDR family oxidoreductase [Aureimonas sp. OT7]|nr:SDR family oxidoreductase [Aureimonas sp. OT7]QOG08532.1 SDR family oxidoreductase [Aureimonas sp. OT7]
MPASGNTILITGGSSGIGRALAEQLHARDNTVIIAARRTAVLQDIASRFPNMHAMTVDVRDPYSVKRLAREIVEKHPTLNVVFNNAGIMRPENVFDGDSALAESSDHIETNLNGPIRLTAALLPHLAKQPRARIVNTSSGLAFVPRATFPTYCATKAGVHSYTVSLRHQLRRTSIDVLELAPPALRTELTPGQSRIEAFMPLDAFINEVLGLLDRNPVPDELIVERAKIQRLAEAEGRFFQTFEAINRADG